MVPFDFFKPTPSETCHAILCEEKRIISVLGKHTWESFSKSRSLRFHVLSLFLSDAWKSEGAVLG